MANEITLSAPSGQTLYALLRDAAAQPFNQLTGAFEPYSAAQYAHYALALAEQGATGCYLGGVPAGFGPAGRYLLAAHQQLGAAPAEGDPALGLAALLWTGSAEAFVLGSASGQAQLDLTQRVPTSNTAQTVGDALNAARSQGFGAWSVNGTRLTLFAPDGLTVVRQFTLDNALSPTSRT